MINHILLICFSIITYEFLNYLGFINIIKLNFKIYQKILKLFKVKFVSDFRKQRLILNYSKSLFIISIKIFIMLICILILIYFLNLFSYSFIDIIISISGIVELSIFYSIYYFVRKKINAKI